MVNGPMKQEASGGLRNAELQNPRPSGRGACQLPNWPYGEWRARTQIGPSALPDDIAAHSIAAYLARLKVAA